MVGLGVVDALGLAIATFWGFGLAGITLVSGSGVGGKGMARITPWKPIDKITKSDRIGREDFID